MQWSGVRRLKEMEKCLIGKIITTTKIGVGAVKEHVMAAWKTKGKIEINVLGFNLFSFTFERRLSRC